MNEQIERITKAENALNRARAALSALEQAWDNFLSAAEDLALLEQYLNSVERKVDLAAEEAGELPSTLYRGVLSQDGIWDLLERRDDLLRSITESLT